MSPPGGGPSRALLTAEPAVNPFNAERVWLATCNNKENKTTFKEVEQT